MARKRMRDNVFVRVPAPVHRSGPNLTRVVMMTPVREEKAGGRTTVQA